MRTSARRLLAVLAAACLLLGVAAVSAYGAEATGDSVTGSGLINDSVGTFYGIDAHSGPFGESPAGTVTRFQSTGFISEGLSGPVTCLNVAGNTAIVGFELDFPPNPPFRGLVRVVDNTASGQPDTLTQNQGPYPSTANPCATLPDPGPTYTVNTYPPANINGFTVVDANPRPTSKDQCKAGGWRNYGTTFRNQGQCVAFVERGPGPHG